jgi:hypothetical protein
MVKKNEVAVTESKEVANFEVEFEAYEIQQSALVLPKVLLMQPLSDLVVAEKAKYGDFVNNLTKEIIGNGNDGLEIIPLSMKSFHVVYEVVAAGKDNKYLRMEPIKTMLDSRKPWTDFENGKEIKRDVVIEFYVMVPSVCSIPMILTFKGQSKKSGDALYTTAFAMAAASQKMPFQKVFSITAEKTKNDKGSFAVLNSRVSRDPTNLELMDASKWYKILKTAVVESEIPEEKTEVQADLAF